jgi:hypothetical protein
MSDLSPAAPNDATPRPSPGMLDRLLILRALLWRILEAGGLFIGLIVLVYLLLGTGSGPFVQGVIANIGTLVTAVTPQALIGVAIVVAITQVMGRR